MAKWKVRNFYATYSEKVVEAETEQEAQQLADCIGWNEQQVLGKCEWTGGEIESADDDEDLTDLTDDDRQTIEMYQEHKRSQKVSNLSGRRVQHETPRSCET